MSSYKLKINLIEESIDAKTRRATIIAASVFTIFVAFVAFIGADASYKSVKNGTSVLTEVSHILTISDLMKFPWSTNTLNSAKDISSTPDNRLNILLLGVGGEGHDGAQLTDTIILVSIDEEKNRIGTLSIPRDLAYPMGSGRFEKINAINAYAEAEHPGEGAVYTADAFSKLFNLRIDRVVKLDFAGFAKFIDALDGIDVDVQQSFTDKEFPTADSLYTSVHFDKGMQHMTGKDALNFVRSRHGNNGEGSDYARSARQQLLISSIRTKLFSIGIMANPNQMSKLWNVISSHMQTNMSVWDAVKILPMASRFKNTQITRHVITDDPESVLVAGNVNGAFMLFPKKADWSDIRALVDDPFSSDADKNAALHPAVRVKIEIKNGTFIAGFAATINDKLNTLGFESKMNGNAWSRNYTKTVIYDMTNGALPDEMAKLKQVLHADVVSANIQNGFVLTEKGYRETIQNSATQFLIILGSEK